MAAHNEILNLKIEDIANYSNDSALIFDGRRYFTRHEIDQIKNLNLNYTGIGR